MFMQIILNLITFVLFILSVALLYSMLLISVETKTYEFGVLRIIGLTQKGVMIVVIC